MDSRATLCSGWRTSLDVPRGGSSPLPGFDGGCATMTTDPQQVPRLPTAGAADDPRRQAAADEDALRVLSIFYFAYGGMAAAFSLVGLAFLFAGTIFGSHGAWWGRPEEQAGAAIAGCFFVAVGSGLFVFLGVTALLRILVGVALRRRRYYTFCLVAAGLTCFDIPLGTATRQKV